MLILKFLLRKIVVVDSTQGSVSVFLQPFFSLFNRGAMAINKIPFGGADLLYNLLFSGISLPHWLGTTSGCKKAQNTLS